MRTFMMKLLLLLPVTLVSVSGFNLDTTNSVIQERPGRSCGQDCMFGFSVAQHSEAGTPWLLVGAPRADSNQPGIHKGGAVYKCPAMKPGNCEIIPFDKGGDALTPVGKKYDEKSGQWFGAVVQSSGADGTVLACAPRYIWYSRNSKRREPIGTCFTTKNNLEEFFEYSPCKTRNWGYHRQGSCQAGIGAAVSENGDQIYVGAVGSWYWQGQVFSMNLDQRNTKRTKEGDPQDDDSYLGYSVATGEFNGDGDKMDVAVGMPRGANLTGKVVLYDSNLMNLNNLTGTQIGAYFGYSLATADLNGDGLHDLIIGAPMWTDYSSMGKFETGRVYVVYQSKEHRFRDHSTLDGKNHKARFGLSLANAGDINIDGYQDIAIGAPYDGPNGKGAVYIYLGSIDGVMDKHSQVIFASDLSPMLNTFGWSISGGMDMDNNKYPDLLVGAYDSGHAVHLRAAPVVHMEAIISYERPSKQIDLDDRSCTLSDRRTSVPCVYVSVSLKYTGMGVPSKLDFDLEFILDALKDKQKRLFLVDAEGTSSMKKRITIRKEEEFKDRFRAYLLGPNIKDKLTSLDVQVKYSLADTNVRRGELVPVLRLGNYMASDSLNIQKDCGPDNRCVPDLSLSINPIESYLMGSEDKLEIQADIINRGEDAFNAIFEVHVPRGVNYVNANTGGSGVSILCSSPNPRNNNTLSCEVGNPLKAGSTVSISILLKPQTEGLLEPISEFTFYVTSKSSNPEEGGSEEDNSFVLTVPIRVETDFRVTGRSIPDQVQFNMSEPLPDKYEFVEEIGDIVTHVYDVKNRGPSSISEAEVYILWPSFNDYGDHLLYLLGFEYDTSRAKCEPLKNLNPLSLKSQMSYFSAQEGGESDVAYGAGGRIASLDTSQGGQGGGSISRSSSSSSSSSSQSVYGSRGQGSLQDDDLDDSDNDDEDDDVYESRIGNRFDSTYTRSQSSSSSNSRNFGVQLNSNVVDGAEETKLFDQSNTQTKSLAGGVSASKNKNDYYASGSNYNANTINSNGGKSSSTSGWRMLPNGTYIREEYQSSSSVSVGGGASGRASGGSSSGSQSSSSDGSDTDWLQQPDGTWIRKTSSSSTYSSQSSSSSAGSRYGADGGGRNAADSGSRYGGSTYNSGSSSSQSVGGANAGSNYESNSLGSGGQSGSIGVLMNAAQGPGDYHGTMSKTELEQEAGGSVFNAPAGTETRSQVEKTRYQGSGVSGGNAGSQYSGEGEDFVTTSRGRWVWSEVNKKWEWEEGKFGGSSQTQQNQQAYSSTQQQQQQQQYSSNQQYASDQQQQNNGQVQHNSGESDSGWTQLPNGQYVRKVSNWSSQNSGSTNYQSGGGGSAANRGGSGSNSDYFESGNIGYNRQSGANQGSGSSSSDSGWTQLPNGTYVRRQDSWSSSSSVVSGPAGAGRNYQAGYGQGSVLHNGPQENGDDGSNSTGWVRQADGTMVMRNSAWSSWSSTGSGDLGEPALQNIQRQLENRARSRIQSLPGNVEPGFEDQYARTHRETKIRKKRDAGDFHTALAECVPGKCTIIKCTMGPMEKDDQLLFKVKSRIFTETLIKNYAERVTVSSKLLTRVTKLPFNVDEEMLAFQSEVVTTTVIPTEPGEAGTPWWVWLLAILLGLTVLGALTYCLYKCGFFKRDRRPDAGPESEPLSNGYH